MVRPTAVVMLSAKNPSLTEQLFLWDQPRNPYIFGHVVMLPAKNPSLGDILGEMWMGITGVMFCLCYVKKISIENIEH